MADVIIRTLSDARNLCPAIFADKPAEHVSSGYTFVSTAAIVDALGKYGWRPEGVAYTRTRRTSSPERSLTKAHGVRLCNDSLPTWGKGRAQLVLRTAHDTSSAIVVRAGIYTFACANQAVVGDTLGAFRVSHLRATLLEIMDGIADLVRGLPCVYEALNAWQSLRLTQEEVRRYQHEALALRYTPGELEAVEIGTNFGRARRYEDNGDTLYQVFQRTQESLVRGGYYVHDRALINGVDVVSARSRNARAISGVDSNIKINTGLWDLTARYAGELGAPVASIAH